MNEKTSVEDGQVVSMEYTLWVDGKVMDSSEGQEPLEYLAGHGNIIPGLENAMKGMKVGESQEVSIVPSDGYGEYDEQAFMDVPRKDFPADMPVETGTELSVTDEHGEPHYARIDATGPENVRLNFNHPLAGKDLKFKVKVVGLREPTQEELEHGHVHAAGHQH
jgi:FKBP-type peptidyl-prolyl cis-trans isomerase SlyD